MPRPNLTVRTNAQATRVVLEGARAVGVSYLDNGEERTVRADAEVLLSGGAINSPQLLMLSGIGPAQHLREHGIDVAVSLPGVGENLHDHPAAGIVWSTRGTTDIADSATPAGLLRWQLTKRGPLASNIGEAGGFYSTVDGLDAPNMQIHVAPTLFYDNGFREPTTSGFTSAATLVDVASRGKLRLRSAHPLWKPVLDPAYYAESADFDAMMSALRSLIEIGRSGPLARFLDKPFKPDRHDLDADALAEENPGEHTDALPPGGHVRDGHRRARRRRPDAQGPRRGRPTRCRRVDHARRAPREHQRADDHGRREGR
jgi:choline dehydrogenase